MLQCFRGFLFFWVRKKRAGGCKGKLLVKTSMSAKSRLFSSAGAITHDLVMIPVAWLGSYWLRFNLDAIPEHVWAAALHYLVFVLPLQAIIFRVLGLYRGVWRFASMPDLLRIVKGVGLGVVLTLALLFVLYRLEDIPRTVPILYAALLVMLLSAPRLVFRWSKDHKFYVSDQKKVLIVGAGHAGEMLARDLLRDQMNAYHPVAFVDDDLSRRGRDLHGISVIGNCSLIPDVVERYSVDIIMLAVPAAKAREKRRLIDLCERAGIPFRIVPQLDDLMSGQVAVNQIREVSIEDLLGREPINLDGGRIKSVLGRKIILVTGAGGSIGSELCRQIASFKPDQLVLVENSEYNLYAIEMELVHHFEGLAIAAHLCDIRDARSVDKVFDLYRPDVVFHAAAYKHVPLLEHQLREAVRNNILGTINVAQAANRFDTKQYVMISTDKVVNPSNIMGCTKRAAEIYCQNLNHHSNTRYSTVRFGNVLGSAGSVVPLFRKQIQHGGPVTVTHPDMERFFMTIPEACQLITQASVLGEGGEIFVLDMGDPIRIQYLAEQMIKLSGKMPGEDIEIVYTGLRPGEKLYEELFHEQEALVLTDHEKVLLAKHRVIDWPSILSHCKNIEQAVGVFDDEALMSELNWFVPENQLNQNQCKVH